MTSDLHEALVEATDQFFFGIDVEGKLCYTNPAFAKHSTCTLMSRSPSNR